MQQRFGEYYVCIKAHPTQLQAIKGAQTLHAAPFRPIKPRRLR